MTERRGEAAGGAARDEDLRGGGTLDGRPLSSDLKPLSKTQSQSRDQTLRLGGWTRPVRGGSSSVALAASRTGGEHQIFRAPHTRLGRGSLRQTPAQQPESEPAQVKKTRTF